MSMGEKEPQEVLDKINVIYQEGKEQQKELFHEKQLVKILESQNTIIKNSNAPETMDSIRAAMNRAPRKSILDKEFLKNNLGDNSLLNKNFAGADFSYDRGVTRIGNMNVSSDAKNDMRNFMIEKLQEKKVRRQSINKRKESKPSYTLPLLTSKTLYMHNF